MTEEPNEEQTQVINWDVNKAAIAKVAEELEGIDAHKDLDGAKAAKKKLTKMRTTLAEAHKETKSKALAFGRKVDAKKNEYLGLIRKIEDPISEQLDEIKNAAAKAEEARVQKIMNEIERIQAYALDRHSLTLEELEARLADLRDQVLSVELLEEFSADAQMAKDEADLKLRLAIDRETQELAERASKERVEAENKELRDKLAKQEAEQAERDTKAKEEQAEKDREARELQEARDRKAKEEADARQKELDDQQAEIDRQKKEQEEAEEAERDRIAAEEAEVEAQKLRDLQAPDVDKLTKYAEAIDHLIGLKPVMGSNAGNSALLDTMALLIDAHDITKTHIEEMK